MTIYKTDPLRDPRWPRFLQEHPGASIFHTPQWLEALHQTYRYKPVVLTTSAPSEPISNGVVFCEINSWLTGRRLVSLPFSDHCEPLFDTPGSLAEILSFLHCKSGSKYGKYVEIRPLNVLPLRFPDEVAFVPAHSFWIHRLDLRGSLDALFRGMHKDCCQRPIQKAKKEGLTLESGTSESLLNRFYGLMVTTRRRQGLPPQPIRWFRNLIKYLGNTIKIHLVSKDGQPAASILTLSYKESATYKYGCSNAQLHRLGGMPFLLWNAIEEAHTAGAHEFDFGRSDLDNQGLVTFKDRFGAKRSSLEYLRYPKDSSIRQRPQSSWKTRLSTSVIERMPDKLLIAAGAALYRHMA